MASDILSYNVVQDHEGISIKGYRGLRILWMDTMDTVRYGNMVDFSFIVSLYVSDLHNVTISSRIISDSRDCCRIWSFEKQFSTRIQKVLRRGLLPL